MKRSRSRSSVRSNERPKVYADCDVLHIKNIPPLWNSNRVKQFIIESCKSKAVIEGIKNIIVLKGGNSGSCLVKFVNSFPCNLALTQLPGTIYNGNKIEVSLDTDNLYHKQNKQQKQEIYKKNTGVGSRKHTQNLLQNNNQQTQGPRPLLEIPLDDMSQQFDVQEDYETYGLSKNFLNALDIKPPLLNKIFVGNLDPAINESKLREVFSYAGQVMQVIVINKDKQRPIAKIEFDHPVEAVQAIAMFNSKELYNKPMLVQMDISRNKYNNLPKGLSSFGPGLGVNGEPLRGVRMHIELQPLKNLLIQEINKLRDKSSQAEQPVNVNQRQIDSNVVSPFNQSPVPVVNVNPFVQPNPLLSLTSLVNPQGLQNIQLLQNLIQQNVTASENSHLPLANIQNQLLQMQGNIQPNSGKSSSAWSSAVPSGSRRLSTDNSQQFQSRSDFDFKSRETSDNLDDSHRHMDDRDKRNKGWWDQDNEDDHSQISTSDMLVFNNLPSSVTVQALNSKMREVGEVKFVEMTGYGRALVRFLHARDAERCVKLFHESKVDGKTIEVRFF